MSKPDYYEILEVSRSAEASVLKKAYRKLALKYHPDRNPDDKEAEENFKLCSEAYEVLRDPEKRKVYDTYGHAGLSGQGFSGFSGVDDIFSSFSDVLGDLFGRGGGRRRRGPERGPDLRYDLHVEFSDAVFGTKKAIQVPRHATCRTCTGTGMKPGTQARSCKTCGGRGQVLHQQGFFTLSTTCPQCQGAGEVIASPCRDCRGAGRKKVVREVTVKVPAGVSTGTRLRLRGEGELGQESSVPGDLYVFIEVGEHPEFVRDGNHVHLPVDIPFVQAALGARLTIPTLKDEMEISVEPGTQPADTLVVRGQGVPDLNGRGRGDLIVHFRVTIPTEINKECAELLRSYADNTGVPVGNS
jgi:molecular chaperone DnaJ